MAGATREHFDAFPDPSPALVPIGPAQLDRMDDALHYDWAWHRHRFTFRKGRGIKVLDAGCGTGLSTLMLARLNPGATVVGVDLSSRSLDLARRRADAAGVSGVEFVEHDLSGPLPAGLGPFDFVVARNVLGGAEEPKAVIATLARALDARGLLLATFPSAAGQMPARQLRRAIEAIVGPGAPLVERAEVGVDLLRSLQPDHPIRRHDAARHGANSPGVEAFVAAYLNDRGHAWTLESATAALEAAGLRTLYASDRGGWRPDRVFGPEIHDRLRDRVGALGEPELARLRDALDVALHAETYVLYACPAESEPHIPDWPDSKDPTALDRLVPHPTGLAAPAGLDPDPSARKGRVTYRTVNGALGELDPRADRALRMADGRSTIAEIESALGDARDGSSTPDARRSRWLDMANLGFVVLESADPRQHVDCVHLGPVRDRLDCACPRRWVRGCTVHELCTISTVGPDDPKAPVLRSALGQLGADKAMACDRCPNYHPDN